MVHIHKLIDFVVTAYIVYKDKVLLIFHKELNKWLPIGGHIELDENPEQALFREIREECGLQIEMSTSKPGAKFKELKFLYSPDYLDIHDISKGHKHISLTYFAKAKSNKAKLRTEEHHQIRWFSEKELEDSKLKIPQNVRFYGKEALKKLAW